MEHTANVNVHNIVRFKSVYRTTDNETPPVISLFIQMMWVFPLQHRILLDTLMVTRLVKKFHVFVGPEGSSVCSKQPPGLGLSRARRIQHI